MSTFCGRMEEIDYISIDNFKGENLKSHAFFLSHCHRDHMRGIDSLEFDVALSTNNAFLYMSTVSKTILGNMYSHLRSKIKELDISGRNFIEIPNIDKTLAVTLIPAGHCPGSVMFLFECNNKVLLYTGDIRIRVNELKKYKQLYDSTGTLKQIDNIYLDTTFFLTSYSHFPLREESITEFCKIINNWLQKDDKNFIYIETPANYGSEYLFMEIFKRCKRPIHVTNKKYHVYKHFPEMDNAITIDGTKTKIHNECEGWKTFCISTFGDKFMLKIKPSAITWKNHDFSTGIVRERNNMTHICYSSHSSYTEIADILRLLKPDKITPCVEHDKVEEKGEMLNCIKEIQEEIWLFRNNAQCEVDDELFQNKLTWTNNYNCASNSSMEINSENSDIFNILDSPESKRTKLE